MKTLLQNISSCLTKAKSCCEGLGKGLYWFFCCGWCPTTVAQVEITQVGNVHPAERVQINVGSDTAQNSASVMPVQEPQGLSHINIEEFPGQVEEQQQVSERKTGERPPINFAPGILDMSKLERQQEKIKFEQSTPASRELLTLLTIQANLLREKRDRLKQITGKSNPANG